MTIETLVKKLNKQVATLQRDIQNIKKVLFVPSRDPEGEYRPAFVRDIRRALKESPRYTFKDKHSFLKQIEKA